MKVTNEKTEKSQAFLTIEMEPAEVAESLEKSYHRLVNRTKIPGFRTGKAPRAILERYVGKESLLEDTIKTLVPEAYEKAVKEQNLQAIAQPKLEITQTEPIVFKAIVPLKPTVKLGDYHQLKIEPEPVKEVTEEDVNAMLEQLRHQHATWEPVERAVEFSDLVVLNIWSDVENKPFINQKGFQFQVLKDVPFPVPGFAEQIVGTVKEEEKEFSLQLPADYPGPEVAGKEAKFKVRVTEIKHEILPELNDELARQIDPEFTTLQSLRERITSDLNLRAVAKANADFEEHAVDAVVGMAEVEFPPILLEVETDRILNQTFRRGQQELDEYLKSVNKTDEELRKTMEPAATKNVTSSLVLGKVAEEEKIEVSESEIDTEIANMVVSAAESNKDELMKALSIPQARQSIQRTLLSRKTVNLLVEIAKGSEETKTTQKEEEK